MDIEVLRYDAGLARAVSSGERASAVALLRAACCELTPGPWEVALGERPHVLGLLVVNGYLMREVSLAGGRSGELLGPGDVLRPWDDPTAEGPLPAESEWFALTPVRVALLDRQFVALGAQWPELLVEIGSRLLRRARFQSALLAISHMPRLEPRLVAMLWHLADRFGHVENGGVAVPLRLTHDAIGLLVGARRPSVSRSMNRIVAAGLVTPRRGGGWLLSGDAAAAIDAAGNPGYRHRGTPDAAGSAAAG